MYQLIDVINNNEPVHKPTILGEPTSAWTFETREDAIQGAGVIGYNHVWNDCFLPVKPRYDKPIWLKLKRIEDANTTDNK